MRGQWVRPPDVHTYELNQAWTEAAIAHHLARHEIGDCYLVACYLDAWNSFYLFPQDAA